MLFRRAQPSGAWWGHQLEGGGAAASTGLLACRKGAGVRHESRTVSQNGLEDFQSSFGGNVLLPHKKIK